jgi:hypothetical protein
MHSEDAVNRLAVVVHRGRAQVEVRGDLFFTDQSP